MAQESVAAPPILPLEQSWPAALSLLERLVGLPPAAKRGQVDMAKAAERVARWKEQAGIGSDELFARRLVAQGMDEQAFLYLLAETPELLAQRFDGAPRWLVDLQEAYGKPGNQQKVPWERLGGGEGAAASLAFLHLADPALVQARGQLLQALQKLSRKAGDVFDPNTAEQALFLKLPVQLMKLLSRTLVLELNVSRLREELEGETSAERLESFVLGLRDRKRAMKIFAEYPTLGRLLHLQLQNWVNFGRELMSNLAKDRQLLEKHLNGGQRLGTLKAIEGNLGDPHRGGRATLMLRFDTGLDLFYKPRSLAIDQRFQELLTWLNERGQEPQLPVVPCLDRGSHGWMARVPLGSCQTEEEVARFYSRQGSFLALFYALSAIDFHYENVIASGENPVPVDLEALFHPRLLGLEIDQAPVLTACHRRLEESVMQVGLLPSEVWQEADGAGVDLSGMGGAGGQETPFEIASLDADEVDAMRFVPRKREIVGADNLPTLDGSVAPVAQHSSSVLEGFHKTYELLRELRPQLAQSDGPLQSFAKTTIRVVWRPTAIYGRLMEESYHPSALSDARLRDRGFDKLWTRTEERPSWQPIILSEQASLRACDIPLFTTRADSRDLMNDRGEWMPEIFEQSGMERAQARMDGLGEKDLAFQNWCVRASMASMGYVVEDEEAVSAEVLADAPSREQLLKTACQLGEQLQQTAIQVEDGSVGWVGLQADGPTGRLGVAPLDLDLYSGLPGVALFLAQLGAVSGESKFRDLAQAAWTGVREMLRRADEKHRALGGFVGWGGVLYVQSWLSHLWQDDALRQETREVVTRIPDLVAGDEELDLMSGAAGGIAGLLAAHRALGADPDGVALQAARQCGEHLLAHAKAQSAGSGWVKVAAGEEKVLAGASHGAAGYALALTELWHASGDPRFRDLAQQALSFERSLYLEERQGWPDLRSVDEEGSPKVSNSWSHGVVGIGLTRARILELDPEHSSALKQELENAVAGLEARGHASDHCLNHGRMGEAELLLRAGSALGDAKHAERAGRLLGGIVQDCQERGVRCGTPGSVETPGLMLGMAGVGLGLLRAAAPEQVGSVLTLQAPPAS